MTRVCLNGDDWRLTNLVPSEWAWIPITKADSDLEHLNPPIPPWIRAMVPGDVQSDLLESGEMGEPWRDLDSRLWEWTSQRDWVYWKDFNAPAAPEGSRAVLRFEGVDYSCHVFLNGMHLGDHVGTYIPFELDATKAFRCGDRNRLIVVVDHAPVEPDQQAQIGWTGKVRLWKPRFAYKWDWCTRLIPLGIWDDVFLEVYDRCRIASAVVSTTMPGGPADLSQGRIKVALTLDRLSEAPLEMRVTATDSEGRVVGEETTGLAPATGLALKENCEVPVQNPELWWPNGSGPQPLYTVTVEVRDGGGEILDAVKRRVGFRHVRAVPNEGAPADALPYTLEVNGQRVFARGWNWAPVNQLYG